MNFETFIDNLCKFDDISILYKYLYLSGDNRVILNIDRSNHTETWHVWMDDNMQVWGTETVPVPLKLNMIDLLSAIENLKQDREHLQMRNKKGEPLFGSRWAEIKYTVEHMKNVTRFKDEY